MSKLILLPFEGSEPRSEGSYPLPPSRKWVTFVGQLVMGRRSREKALSASETARGTASLQNHWRITRLQATMLPRLLSFEYLVLTRDYDRFFMPYDFDSKIDRRSAGSAKWSYYPQDVIPMWVADMDFKSAEPITQALTERIAHGVFGYELPSTSLQQTIIGWLKAHYAWEVQPDDLVFLPGLVSGLNLSCRAFGHIGDAALMVTPVYPPFLSAPENNGMTARKVQLTRADDNGHVRYVIDFDALEKAITPRTRMLIHCHPHNPIGQEFTPDDMRRLGELCLKHNLVQCSDEIHCDLMLGGAKHTPAATLSPDIAEHTVTLMAPSKTFNIPGLGFSFAIVTNKRLRQQLTNAEAGIIPHINALGLTAAQAAYTEGEGWLTALLDYLTVNRDTMLDFIAENMPGVKAAVPAATYLGWFDCASVDISGNPYQFFLKEAKVAVNDGAMFGPGGEGFVRFNFGCPRLQMIEALTRMADALHKKAGAH